MIDLTIEGTVAEVVLNAPEKMNAVNEAALAELSAAYDEAAAAGVRALLLRGEGRGFCAGPARKRVPQQRRPTVTCGPLYARPVRTAAVSAPGPVRRGCPHGGG